jgi:hypothetical protein
MEVAAVSVAAQSRGPQGQHEGLAAEVQVCDTRVCIMHSVASLLDLKTRTHEVHVDRAE